MAADPKSVSVEALKSAFKEGATPNEEDYHALIDLAAVGGKALGGDNKTTPTLRPGEGLQMDAGKLAVKVKKDAGVTLDGDGVAVKGDGKTVTVTAAGVGIKVKTNGGLESNTTDGLHVKTGSGLKTDKSGLEIKLAEKGALKADNDGLAVQVAAGAGLEIDAKTGLKVKLKAGKDNYIESTDAGLAITPQGIDAIKSALKSVSLDALDAAVKGTSQGYKQDSNNPAAGDVEAKIAEQLNVAYAEGWKLTQARAALFNALKVFRETNKDKIYKEGLIAPSAMTGKPGLYNQVGVEYGAGTVIAFKVGPAGIAELSDGGDYKKDGIYALVGKTDATGTPKAGDAYDKVTPQALMVLVTKAGVVVVGHWDFANAEQWENGVASGSWTPAPTQDAVSIRAAEARVRESERSIYVEEVKGINQRNETALNNLANDHAAKMQGAIDAVFRPSTLTFRGKTSTMAMRPDEKGGVVFTTTCPNIFWVDKRTDEIRYDYPTKELIIRFQFEVNIVGHKTGKLSDKVISGGKAKRNTSVELGFEHIPVVAH